MGRKQSEFCGCWSVAAECVHNKTKGRFSHTARQLLSCPTSLPLLPSQLRPSAQSLRTASTLPSTSPSHPRPSRSAMQTAVQQLMPPLHSQFAHRNQYPPHPSLNGAVARTANGILNLPTPPVASSSTTRKRKRNQQQYSVSYSEIQEVDHEGRLRDVIVIEDTPPPPATVSPAPTVSTATNGAYSMSHQPPLHGPIRTRARAAAEAQQLQSSASSSVMAAPAAKKRKREPEPEAASSSAKRVPGLRMINGALHYPPPGKSWASGSGAATEDVRNPAVSLLPITDDRLVLGVERSAFL